MTAKAKNSQRSAVPSASLYEVVFLEGLTDFVQDELTRLPVKVIQQGAQATQFHYKGATEPLKHLKMVTAVYRVENFDIPRPKALLGHEVFTQLVKTITEIKRQERFQSFRIEAAGRDSTVFQRLREALEKALELPFDPEGDLQLRIRKGTAGKHGSWQVLIRLTAKPLSARAWRVCNMPGGLNACLAQAMLELARLEPKDRLCNPMCGSGTLVIEAARGIALDISAKALACAQQNVEASGLKKIHLVQADVTAMPYPENSFEVIVSDLPWGDAVGSHRDNADLYPAFLQEMARVASPQARMVLLTHEVRLFEKLLQRHPLWRVAARHRVYHGGHYPRIYCLQRR